LNAQRGVRKWFLQVGGHLAAILSSGRAVSRGRDKGGQVSGIPELNAQEVDRNSSGKGTPPGSHPFERSCRLLGLFVMVSASWGHIAAITSSGRVVCWGRDKDGQVSGTPELNAQRGIREWVRQVGAQKWSKTWPNIDPIFGPLFGTKRAPKRGSMSDP
jgi:hypothetical protein